MTIDARPHRLPCPWARVDAAGVVLDADARLLTLTGGVVEQVVGQPFDRLLTAASRVLYQSHLQPLLRLHGETAELSMSLRRAGGGGCDVLVYTSRVDDADPASPIDMVFAPIQRRREIEAELLRIKRAADQAPGVVFQLGRRPAGGWVFRYVSAAVGALYGAGTAAAEADAQVVFDQLHDHDRDRLRQALDEAATTGRGRTVTVRRREPTQVHEWQFEAAMAADGSTLWRGYVADVTARHHAQETERRRAEAEDRVRMHSEFLARAGHELRTPLNAILGFSQLLVAGATESADEERRRTAGLIDQAGRHLLRLVERLLDIAEAERRAPALELGPVELFPLLDAALHRAALPSASGHAVPLTLRCVPDLRALVDATALQQVLDNLLSNAVKYTGPQGRVAVEARAGADGRVDVTVSDTGPGLAPAQLARLFEPFNRLGAESGAVPGVGLGLVIARQLAQAMDGELTVTSEPGVGTIARVRLPAAPAHERPPPAPAPADATPTPSVRPPGAAARPPTAGSVLYVEDDPVNTLLMEAILAARPGVRLRVADTVAAAVRSASESTPDLLLLDLNLPDGRGDMVLQRLREDGGGRVCPAVLVTAAAGDATQRLVETAGFDALWAKPLDVARVLDDIDRLLGADTVPS